MRVPSRGGFQHLMPITRFLAVRTSILVALCALASSARADNDPVVQRGVAFLRARAGTSQIGETALTALALLKAEVPPGDPAVSACINKLQTRFKSGVYDPERRGGADVYEAAVVALAMSNLDPVGRRTELAAVANYIIGLQKPNGSWDYPNRTNGDTSISQYAVLGLWEAENGGVTIPPSTWDQAAQWFMSTQASGGSWAYHRDEGGKETLAMTAAGVGSLLICQRQLARYRRSGPTTSLLVPLDSEGQLPKYTPTTPSARIDQSVKLGLSWLAANFTTASGPIIGQTPYYTLYGTERVGALANREILGKVSWFDEGRRYIVASQRGDGAWDATYGDVANTVWAILFLTKSTAKTIKRVDIKHLGAGTLLGGRGLPRDLSNLTVAGGRVVSRPMNGAVEGMLSALEDPRAENADTALSGLIVRYRTEGAAALRPHKDRFRKLQSDRDPGLRKVAVWGLARTGDLDVVPALIDSLADPDEEVVSIARDGLQLVSRKIVGHGPPNHSTPEQRQEAAKRWRAWYALIRPLDLEGQDEDAPSRSQR